MVSFNQIPSTVRTPFFFVEFDGVPAETEALDIGPALILAQKTSTGTADANVPIRIINADDASAYFGTGSHAHRMVKMFRKSNSAKELWVIPLADNGTTKREEVITVRVTPDGAANSLAAVAGTITMYIAGQKVQAAVATGDTAETIATTLRDEIIDLETDLPVNYKTASITVKTTSCAATNLTNLFTTVAHGLTTGMPIKLTGTVPAELVAGTQYYAIRLSADTFSVASSYVLAVATTAIDFSTDGSGISFTENNAWQITVAAKNAGTLGNDIDFRLNYLGPAAGERTPSEVTVTTATSVPGDTDPSLSTAITAMGTELYDYVLCPYAGTTELDALKSELDDRWAYNRQVYGHVVSIKRDTEANLLIYGALRNNRHESVFGVYDYPSPIWDILGKIGGELSNLLDNDPALPEQALPLDLILPPKVGSTGRFTLAEREALLEGGIATLSIGRTSCAIERAITTYQTNAQDVADVTYLDIQTAFTMMRCARYMKRRIVTKFGRKKLGDDNSRLPASANVVTPSIVFNELVMIYGDLIELGWVEDMSWFKANCKVVRDSNDVNRLNVLFPPDFINQLRVFATLFRFKQ